MYKPLYSFCAQTKNRDYYEHLNYDQVLLTPQYSETTSRSTINTSIEFGWNTFQSPIILANMKTVIDEKLAIRLAKKKYFYVMHRFNNDSVSFNKKMHKKWLISSISLWVNEDAHETIDTIKKNKDPNPHYITIDIAHGHCKKMKDMIQYCKKQLPKSFIIAGNVCTTQWVQDLEKRWADAVKIWIWPGSVCTTRLKTWFSCPQFSAVLKCAKIATVPVIADWWIQHNGDIAKAIAAWATMIMAWWIFAWYDESPWNVIYFREWDREVKYKEYFWSASEHNKKEKKNIEWRKTFIPLRGSLKEKLEEVQQDLQSSISYAGWNSLQSLKNIPRVIIH